MSNKKSSRRNLMKSLAAGSGAIVAGKSLPESWTRPVVDSVMLPAHAQTTDATGDLPVTPCCLTEQTYCAWIGNGRLYIDVAANGGITVRIQIDGIITLTDSVSCTEGGDFEVNQTSEIFQGDFNVTGSVNCSSTSISGTYTAPNANPVDYIAEVNGCVFN